MADFCVTPACTMTIVRPLTDDAERWLKANVQSEPYQWRGGALLIEARYAEPIVEHIQDEGFEIEFLGMEAR